MVLVLNLILALVSTFILYQDWKYRAVQWILFPLLIVVGIGFYWLTSLDWKSFLMNVLFNVCFLFIQLIILWIVFFIRERNKLSVFAKIGFGDVLFLACSTTFFSPFNFFFFYFTSLFFSIFCYYLFQYRRKSVSSSIPLAGYQSVYLSIIGLIIFLRGGSWFSDDWIIQIIGNL